MNILYLSPNAQFGGAERILETLLKYHDRQRFNLSLAFLNQGPLVEDWKKYQLPIELLPKFRMRAPIEMLRSQRALSKLIRQNKIDLIHSTMAYGHLYAGPVALFRGTREVWFQHGPVGSTLDRLAGLVPTSTVLFNSKYTLAQQNFAWSKQKKVVYGPVSIPEKFEETIPAARKTIRSQYHVEEEDFLFLHLARMEAWKGQELFLDSLFPLMEKNSKAKALLVGGSALGDRTFEKNLHEKVLAKGLSHRIVFCGEQKNTSDFFAAADCYVHSATIPEPLGLSILEALASGCPVIAADAGGPKELLGPEAIGSLYTINDSLALQAKMNEMIQNQNSLQEVRDKGKRFAKQFEAKVWVQRIEEIYDELPKL